MWIKRSDYDAMLGRALESQGAREVLERQLTAQKTTMEWLMFRLTQLEHERASLLHRYTGVTVTVPTVQLDAPPVDTVPSTMSDVPDFNDVGDAQAKKLGLDWDTNGRVMEHGRAIS